MVKHRISILFEDGHVIVQSKDTGDLVAQGKEEHRLYYLSALVVHGDTSHPRLWHDRFGHINFGTLAEMLRSQMVDGLPLIVVFH